MRSKHIQLDRIIGTTAAQVSLAGPVLTENYEELRIQYLDRGHLRVHSKVFAYKRSVRRASFPSRYGPLSRGMVSEELRIVLD